MVVVVATRQQRPSVQLPGRQLLDEGEHPPLAGLQLRRDFRESTEDNDNYKHVYYLTTSTGG